MCGRFSLFRGLDYDPEEPKPRFSEVMRLIRQIQSHPRYNVAPTQPVAAILSAQKVENFRWGLVPRWSKDGKPNWNARAETLTKKASFKDAFKSQRCLIPADGFYEWKEEGRKRRPYLFRLKSKRIFFFAGLWDRWIGPGGTEISTCTVVTTTPNRLTQTIHDRMPVMLKPEAAERWLDEQSGTAELQKLLVPYPLEEMEALEVNAYVNDARNEGPKCQEPPDEELLLF